jgi:enolase
VPSGASTGSREALELRDEEKRFSGKGVRRVCRNIEEIIFPAIQDFSVFEQEAIDRKMLELDGTDNKSKLGANAILAVSLVVCRAAAQARGLPLWQYIREVYNLLQSNKYNFPVPMMNVVNGGGHADSGLDIQEFMAVPSGLKSFEERVMAGAEIYHNLKKIFSGDNYRVAIGDEGGFAPQLESNKSALEYINRAIESSLYNKDDIHTGIDAAASEFYDKENEVYNLKLDEISLDSKNLQAMYEEWIEKYNLEVIEDPMSEFDWKGWSEFNKDNQEKVAIIGDDLLVTNKKLIEEAIERKACNAALIKVNQIGSLSETIDSIMLAKESNMKIAVSHRSGETVDDFIADLAVAVEAEYVKFGAPARGERVCKYNRIVEIEKNEFKKS